MLVLGVGCGACYWVLKAQVMAASLGVVVGLVFLGSGVRTGFRILLFRPYVENYTVDASICNQNVVLVVNVSLDLAGWQVIVGWLVSSDSLDKSL